MPSNNLLAQNQIANNMEFKPMSGFSQVNMSQTGPRIKTNIDGEDLPAPTEIYNRVEAMQPGMMNT